MKRCLDFGLGLIILNFVGLSSNNICDNKVLLKALLGVMRNVAMFHYPS